MNQLPENITDNIFFCTNIINEILDNFRSDPCQENEFQIFRQKHYIELYNKIDINNIERFLLEMKNNDSNDSSLIGLSKALSNLEEIYKANYNRFNSLNIENLFTLQIEISFDRKITIAKKDIEDVKNFEYYIHQEKENNLKYFNNELTQIQNKRSDFIREHADSFLKNYYVLIFKATNKIREKIDIYFPKKNHKNEEKYFTLNIASSIHNLCNKTIFEDQPAALFCQIWNLNDNGLPLTIVQNKKNHVYHLIKECVSYIQNVKTIEEANEWKTKILEITDIELEIYKSKQSEISSFVNSKKKENRNEKLSKKDFYNRIKLILNEEN